VIWLKNLQTARDLSVSEGGFKGIVNIMVWTIPGMKKKFPKRGGKESLRNDYQGHAAPLLQKRRQVQTGAIGRPPLYGRLFEENKDLRT